MTLFATSVGDFLRSSRLGAIGVALVGYFGLARLVGAIQDLLMWAIPAFVAFSRKNGLPNLPEIPYSRPDWELVVQSLSAGVLLLALATALAFRWYRTGTPAAEAR